jgi:RNA polymerase sigma-70 factor (ECF subfamily)
MVCNSFSDQELIKAYLDGNEAALAILVERHQERVFGYLYNKVRNREVAEDLFQEVFIKLVNKLKKGVYIEEGKFSSWLMRVSHNLTIDYFRKAAKNRTTSGGADFDIFDVIADEPINMEEMQLHKLKCDNIAQLVDTLPEKQKEVVKMRMYYDMSFKEIAEETGVSINTALGRMRYALLNLRKMVDEVPIYMQ